MYPGNDIIIDIGSGKEKTEEILLMMANEEYGQYVAGKAAQLCDTLVVNGFDDWFLPSIEELTFMYVKLWRAGIGNFSGTYYWSSSASERVAGIPYMLHFDYGSKVNRWENGSVRAVRAF
jgi:hypothetical protein